MSRALSLATVTLLIGCFAVIPVQAQNLEAGKSPSQIFAGTCNACHKSPPGLLSTVAARGLPPPAPLPRQAAKHDAEPRPAARPDAGGLFPQADLGQPGRNAKRLARPGEAPDAARAKLSKRGGPGSEEPPKSEAAKTDA